MARRGRGHPIAEEAGETRRMILRAAHRLFMEQGYRAVSTRQIAEACGLTQPALYHHFADKQELYVEVLNDELAMMRAALERIVNRSESVEDRLRQIVRFIMAHTSDDLSQMFHDIQHELEPQRREEVGRQFHVSMVAPIAAVFADGHRLGVLRTPNEGGADPLASAYLLVGMLRPATQHRVGPEGTPDAAPPALGGAAQAEALVQILLYGLARPVGAGELPGSPPTPQPVAGDNASET